MQPGDTVSLVVRSKNQQQQFVDVGSLLAALQNVPPSSDGAHHVFLAPPNFPVPDGAQRFHVTYVAPTPATGKKPTTGSHPPLFVAPLDYNVPHGYSRVQIPTRQVKFTTNPNTGVLNVLTPQQQPRQPLPPPTPAPVVFRQPPPPPPPTTAAPPPPPPQPQFVPQPPVFRQPLPVAVPAPLPAPVAQPASLFDQALADIQTGFVPSQGLDEAPQPVVAPVRKEPLVLAMETPAFLLPEPTAAPVPQVEAQAAPAAPEEPVVAAPVALEEEEEAAPVSAEAPVAAAPVASAEEPAEPVASVEEPAEPVASVEEPAEPVASVEEPAEPVASAEEPAAPVQEPVAEQQPAEPVAEVEPVAVPVEAAPAVAVQEPEEPAPEVKVEEPVPEKEDKRKKVPATEVTPVKVAPTSGDAEAARPLFPDFQSARQQQINRQQGGPGKIRTKVRVTSSASAPSAIVPSSFGGETSGFQFGQKLRPAIKTNALVSPPLPVPAVASFESVDDEVDPPVQDRDDSFQTLESQNAASAVNRGRIRFRGQKDSVAAESSSKEQLPENSIPAATAAPVEVVTRRPASAGGRGRVRLTTTAPPVTTTTAPTTTALPDSGSEEVEEEEVEDSSAASSVNKSVEEPSEEEESAEVSPEVASEAAPEVASEAAPEVASEAAPEVVSDAAPEAVAEAAPASGEPVAEEEEDLIKLLAPKEEVAVAEQPEAADQVEEKSKTEEPWSPYEAVRQMQTTEEKRIQKQPAESGEVPVIRPNPGSRIRGRIRGDQLINRPLVGNRPGGSRPLTTVIRKKPIKPVIIDRPQVIPDRDPEEIRILREGFSPAAPEFGIRATGQVEKVVVTAPPPSNSFAPVFLTGRRVPETGRPIPAAQGGIRISRPTLTIVNTEEQEIPDAEVAEQQQSVEEDVDEEADPEEEEDSVAEGSQKEVASTTAAPVPTTTEAAATTASDDQLVEEEEDVEPEAEDQPQEEPSEPQVEQQVNEEVTTSTAPSVTTSTAPSASTIVADVQEAEQEQEVNEPERFVTEAPAAAAEAAPETVATIEAPVKSLDNALETDQKVLGVSTATEVSLMYELCFRGRCIRVHE